jgi:glycine/D-amino acid oxidase-like deaminating enzyme
MTEHIIIVGAGIIGSTTAFYLSRARLRPARITLIEASKHGPAQGASGKAGGLVGA